MTPYVIKFKEWLLRRFVMKKSQNYIFFDEILTEYMHHFNENGEHILIEDLKKYLNYLSKTSRIILITKQDILKINEWLIENDLLKFIDNVTNPVISNF